MDIFKFVKRDAIPEVTSGKVIKMAGGYQINLIRNDQVYNYFHQGNLDKKALLSTIKQIRAVSDFNVSRGADPSYNKPFRGRRSGGKPTQVIDDAVVELSGGFTVGGLQNRTYLAGDPSGEHWIMSAWNASNFDLFDINDNTREFLRRHLSAIAYKANPGAEPEIDYFTTSQLAMNRLLMLQQKHGAPFGAVGDSASADVAPASTPDAGEVSQQLTVDRSIE